MCFYLRMDYPVSFPSMSEKSSRRAAEAKGEKGQDNQGIGNDADGRQHYRQGKVPTNGKKAGKSDTYEIQDKEGEGVVLTNDMSGNALFWKAKAKVTADVLLFRQEDDHGPKKQEKEEEDEEG